MPSDDIENDKIEVGHFFEGCSFHPLVCIESDYENDSLMGISLVDGSMQSCSVRSCGVRKLTPREAITWRLRGPQDIDARCYGDPDEWEPERQWWKHEGNVQFSYWDPKTHDLKPSD